MLLQIVRPLDDGYILVHDLIPSAITRTELVSRVAARTSYDFLRADVDTDDEGNGGSFESATRSYARFFLSSG